MILVTGAAGKTGQAVIRALAQRKTAVRALVHKETQRQTVQTLGVQEVVVGDMGSRHTMNDAARGVQAVYHICSNVNPQELEMGQVVIQAAQTAGIRRFVFHSVFHPHIEAMPHHWQKMRVEEKLFESGLAYTILQPAPYMQNILAYWDDIVGNGRYAIPYSIDAHLGCVDLDDVAEVAATVLTEPGHEGAIYELCGIPALSQQETAKIISRLLGRHVQVETIPVAVWADAARQKGLEEYQIATLSNMFRYYDQFGYWGNSQVLTFLLKHPTTTFSDMLKQTITNR